MIYAKKEKLREDYKIANGAMVEQSFNIFNLSSISNIYILINGFYWNTDKLKKYPIEELYYYDNNEGVKGLRYGFKIGEDREKIISFIKMKDPEYKNVN